MAASLDQLLPRAAQAQVVAAIAAAEARTSGQIKVHVEASCGGDALARATALLHSLGLTATRHRNAVLVYLAPRDRKFAIVGDEGIHARGGAPLWERARAAMAEGLGRGSLGDGLVAAVAAVGAALAAEFPPEPGAGNPISDDFSSAEGEGAPAAPAGRTR